MVKMVADFGFCDMNYEYLINKIIQKEDYMFDDVSQIYTLEKYIESASNHIIPYGIEEGIDEEWIWAFKESIFSDFNDLTTDEFRYLLTEIFIRMVQKGGKLVDNNLQENREHHQFEEKMKKGDLSYIDDLVDFMIKNPDYGEDGGGFWFYP